MERYRGDKPKPRPGQIIQEDKRPPKRETTAEKKKPGRPPKKKEVKPEDYGAYQKITPKRCGYCKYWQEQTQYYPQKKGRCFRYPIVPDVLKNDYDWCGEHKSK